MSAQVFFLILTIGILGVFFYTQQSLRGKLLCFFHRPNRTIVEKKISLRSKYVIFDGGRFVVNPKRISLIWYKRGFHSFFPTFIPSLTYKWDTDQPLDPTTFQNTWDTPEARQAARGEESWKGFAKGVSSQVGKKQGGLEKYLPWISIALTLVVGYLVYQMSQHLTLLENLIKVK